MTENINEIMKHMNFECNVAEDWIEGVNNKVLKEVLEHIRYRCIEDFLRSWTYKSMNCSKYSDAWYFNIIDERLKLINERTQDCFINKELTESGLQNSGWLMMETCCLIVSWFYKLQLKRLEETKE